MAYGDSEFEDAESLGNRLCGAIDAVADLLAGHTPGGLHGEVGDLTCLMRLIASEAHNLHDTKSGARRPRASNDDLGDGG